MLNSSGAIVLPWNRCPFMQHTDANFVLWFLFNLNMNLKMQNICSSVSWLNAFSKSSDTTDTLKFLLRANFASSSNCVNISLFRVNPCCHFVGMSSAVMSSLIAFLVSFL